MGFLLKPGLLENATSAADVQKLMKADLKNNAGKKGVKFIAAKNAIIGGKTVQLFIVTDNAAPFEAILKAKFPKAYRAKGTCDLDKESGKTKVTIRTSVGQMLPDAVAKLMPEVVAHDSSFVAHVEPKGDASPGLKPTGVVHGGVPEWAKEEYKEQSKRTVIASMTPDGKIGSVYFSDGSRIRTTHGVGPAKEQHAKERSVQFNVDESQARLEYRQANVKLAYDAWLQRRLVGVTPSNAPSWATIIASPEDAKPRDSEGKPQTGGTTLIEIFKSINGKLEGWHPSRGTATKFATDSQTISVLQAAIKQVDSQYPKVSDHDELDPAVARRQQEIVEEFRRRRANPDANDLKTLWKDQTIAGQMKLLRLTKPSIDVMDQDSAIEGRIDQIYNGSLQKALKKDNVIQQRIQEMEHIRSQRNVAFYEFVKNRLPNSDITKSMRKPDEV